MEFQKWEHRVREEVGPESGEGSQQGPPDVRETWEAKEGLGKKGWNWEIMQEATTGEQNRTGRLSVLWAQKEEPKT